MTTYMCTGDCGGTSEEPGVCQAEGCTMHGQPLIEVPTEGDEAGDMPQAE